MRVNTITVSIFAAVFWVDSSSLYDLAHFLIGLLAGVLTILLLSIFVIEPALHNMLSLFVCMVDMVIIGLIAWLLYNMAGRELDLHDLKAGENITSGLNGPAWIAP